MAVDKPFQNRRATSGVWVAIPLQTNYVAFGGGFPTPAYCIIGDFVYLRGLVGRITSTAIANAVLGTLPVGARPTAGLAMFEQHLTGTRCRMDVNTVGQIIHIDQALTVGGYASLDGMFFAIN